MEFANSTARLNIAVLLKVLMKKLKYYACKFSHLQVKSSNLMSTYVFRPIYLAQLKSWAIDKFTDTHLKKYHVNSNQNNKRKVHVQHNTLFLKTALCLVKCIPKLSPGNVQKSEEIFGTYLEIIFGYDFFLIWNPGTPRIKISCLWLNNQRFARIEC